MNSGIEFGEDLRAARNDLTVQCRCWWCLAGFA